MDLDDWQNLNNRLDSAHQNAMSIGLWSRDLWTMDRAVRGKLREADQEWVNCRKKGVGSPRFDELMAQAEEALKNLEGHVILAKLMHKEPR
jgi:hypothetical protein